MPPKIQLDRFAIVLMVIFCTVWGSQQVVIKYANAGISPVWQAGLRSIGAVVLVMLWSVLRGVRLFERDRTLLPGLLAGLLFSLEFGLLYWALEYTTASRGVIFLYTAPFMVAMGAVWLLPQEHMRPAQWAGMMMAFVGVLALFGESLLLPAESTWVGDLMMFAAAVFWAGTTLTIKVSTLARAAPEKMLLYQLAVSAVVLPILALAFGEAGVFAPSPMVWASLAFQILVVATASYIGWFWLIRNYPITRLSSFSFLTPVMGVVAGSVLLGETPTPAVFMALGMVALGIWVANRPARTA
ncbi:EamA family transporter [Parazoarcus communis]|uniref:EamA family transporter n=1 Tax=Parazoarcus communis TaxID=41977 RepID=A0A2U8GSQ4_9RHOO|nr:DMT family transporter [Parazoarcus communis]AWI76727.1 EamA family transporter [Parazoarcus communis]|tara:strand:+ start:8923 stop:9819 length:897 start_codon:yes stop_codon:yes gene_type:complete